MTQLQPVLLSGGSGTRLWPLSREAYPKQFLALSGDRTMLQDTWLRVAPIARKRASSRLRSRTSTSGTPVVTTAKLSSIQFERKTPPPMVVIEPRNSSDPTAPDPA